MRLGGARQHVGGEEVSRCLAWVGRWYKWGVKEEKMQNHHHNPLSRQRGGLSQQVATNLRGHGESRGRWDAVSPKMINSEKKIKRTCGNGVPIQSKWRSRRNRQGIRHVL